MDTTTNTTEYTIPGNNLPTLLERIEKLNKRARRMQIPEITITTKAAYMAREYQPNNGGGTVWRKEGTAHFIDGGATPTGKTMAYHTVAVTGTAPKYAGWEFVATLEPLEADGKMMNLVLGVPGAPVCPTGFMATESVGRCDHCNTRRDRKQTFVVRHDNGEYKAVGRTCLRDFLGHEDPNRLAAWAEFLVSLGSLTDAAKDNDWLGGGGAGGACYDLEHYLTWVAAAVREHGWLGRGKARENEGFATADRVLYLLQPPSGCSKEYRAAWEADVARCTPTNDDKRTAADAMAWARDLDMDALVAGDADAYLANIAVLARAGYVEGRTFGFGASIITAANRAADKAAKLAAAPTSNHVGTPGTKDTYRVCVGNVTPYEGNYGTTYITRMRVWDEAQGQYANDLVWWASRQHDLTPGGEYTITARIKKHDAFNNRPQTVITHVKVA